MKISDMITIILIIVLLGSIAYLWIGMTIIGEQSQKNLDYQRFSYNCFMNIFMNGDCLTEDDRCYCLIEQKKYVKDDVFLQEKYLDYINKLINEKC